jgi:hypothetical protein
MTTLTRRALIGSAALLATTRIPDAEAQEQCPPDGYTFCETCEGEGWETRFGAVAAGNWDDRIRWTVMEGASQLLHVLAVGPETQRWVAEIVWGREQVDANGEAWRPVERCDCGRGDFKIRVSYRDVQLIDGWA